MRAGSPNACAGGEPALLRRGRGEAREADHVADRVDVRRRRCGSRSSTAIRPRSSASRPAFVELELVGRALAARRVEDGVGRRSACRSRASSACRPSCSLDRASRARRSGRRRPGRAGGSCSASTISASQKSSMLAPAVDHRHLACRARRTSTRTRCRSRRRRRRRARSGSSVEPQDDVVGVEDRSRRRSRRPARSGRLGADRDHDLLGGHAAARRRRRRRPRACAGRRTAPRPRAARRGCAASWSRITSRSRSITCRVRARRSSIVISSLTR